MELEATPRLPKPCGEHSKRRISVSDEGWIQKVNRALFTILLGDAGDRARRLEDLFQREDVRVCADMMKRAAAPEAPLAKWIEDGQCRHALARQRYTRWSEKLPGIRDRAEDTRTCSAPKGGRLGRWRGASRRDQNPLTPNRLFRRTHRPPDDKLGSAAGSGRDIMRECKNITQEWSREVAVNNSHSSKIPHRELPGAISMPWWRRNLRRKRAVSDGVPSKSISQGSAVLIRPEQVQRVVGQPGRQRPRRCHSLVKQLSSQRRSAPGETVELRVATTGCAFGGLRSGVPDILLTPRAVETAGPGIVNLSFEKRNPPGGRHIPLGARLYRGDSVLWSRRAQAQSRKPHRSALRYTVTIPGHTTGHPFLKGVTHSGVDDEPRIRAIVSGVLEGRRYLVETWKA